MRLILTLALILSLAGCSTYWLYPPGGNDAQWNRDVYECTKDAQQESSAAYVGAYGGSAQSGTDTNYELRDACLRARGYHEK